MPTNIRVTSIRLWLTNHSSWVWFFLILLISVPGVYGYFQYLGGSGFPGLHWDASLYSTVIINAANGRGWIFDSFAWALVANPERQYTGHGFLSILVHGVLLKADSWRTLEHQFVYCNTITYVLWFAVFSVGINGSRFRLLNAALSAFLTSYMTMCLQGRPEHLAAILLAVPAFLWSSGRRDTSFHVCWAVISGLLFCTSPALGLLSAMFTVVLLGADARKRGQWKTVCWLIASGALSIAVSCLVLATLHPFGMLTWISDTVYGSATAPDLSMFFFSFGRTMILGLSVSVPFWNVIALSAMVYGFWRLSTERAYFLAALFLLFSVQCILRMADYGVVSMFPMLMALSRSAMCRFQVTDLRRICLATPQVACLIASGFTFQQAFAINESGNTRDVSAQRIMDICGADSVVAYHMNCRPSLVTLHAPSIKYVGTIPERVPFVGADTFYRKLEIVTGAQVEWFIYPQTYRGSPPEAIYLGSTRFDLIFSDWTIDRYRVVGIPLVGRKPGFHVAIYGRQQRGSVELNQGGKR